MTIIATLVYLVQVTLDFKDSKETIWRYSITIANLNYKCFEKSKATCFFKFSTFPNHHKHQKHRQFYKNEQDLHEMLAKEYQIFLSSFFTF